MEASAPDSLVAFSGNADSHPILPCSGCFAHLHFILVAGATSPWRIRLVCFRGNVDIEHKKKLEVPMAATAFGSSAADGTDSYLYVDFE